MNACCLIHVRQDHSVKIFAEIISQTTSNSPNSWKFRPMKYKRYMYMYKVLLPWRWRLYIHTKDNGNNIKVGLTSCPNGIKSLHSRKSLSEITNHCYFCCLMHQYLIQYFASTTTVFWTKRLIPHALVAYSTYHTTYNVLYCSSLLCNDASLPTNSICYQDKFVQAQYKCISLSGELWGFLG